MWSLPLLAWLSVNIIWLILWKEWFDFHSNWGYVQHVIVLFLCEKHYHLHFTNCKPNGANQLCLEWKFGLCSMSEPARIKCPILVILDFIYRYHHTRGMAELQWLNKSAPYHQMIGKNGSVFLKNSDYFTLELTFILTSLAATLKKTIRNELYVIYFDND